MVSLKTPDQLSETNAPFLPSLPQTFEWQGKTYDIYVVTSTGGTSRSPCSSPAGRRASSSIPRTRPPRRSRGRGVADARTRVDVRRRRGSNFADVWAIIDFPRLLFNTIAIAIIGMIGTVVSCTLVAYGFARFRFPGRSILFTLLIATIFLPSAP